MHMCPLDLPMLETLAEGNVLEGNVPEGNVLETLVEGTTLAGKSCLNAV